MASFPGKQLSSTHTRYLLLAAAFFFVAAALAAMLSFRTASAASHTLQLLPTGGTDATLAQSQPITPGNLDGVQTVDAGGSRSAIYTWPTHALTYNESRYVEYTFDSPNLPASAVIDSVTLNHVYYYPNTAVTAAKAEVWDGTAFTDVPLSVPTVQGAAGTVTDAKDITAILATPAQVNAAKVRFLSYASGGAPARTEEDYLALEVAYHLPPPVAAAVTSATNVDTPVTIDLSGTDVGGAALTYAIAQAPSKGTLGAISGNEVTYTPTGAIGTDTFAYTVNNGSDSSAPATVTISLVPGVLHSLALAASPNAAATGTQIALTATAYDSFGNVLTNDSGTQVTVAGTGATVAAPTATLSAGTASYDATASAAASVDFVATAGSVSSPAVAVVFSDPDASLPESAPSTGSDLISPIATPNAGTYAEEQSVSLSTTSADASIHYTTDGTLPNCASPLYEGGAFSVTASETIQAVACDTGGVASPAASFAYVIAPVVARTVGGGGVPASSLYATMGDVNGDGKVDMQDVTALLLAWGTGSKQSDVNRDGTVDLTDFNALMVHWKP